MCVLRFCRECERTALKANKDVRVALIHIGVVLGKDGCALGVLGKLSNIDEMKMVLDN